MCEKGAEPTDGGGSAATCPDEGAVQTSSCKKCDPGRFKAGSGSEKCAPCGVGKYCGAGATVTEPCAKGKSSADPKVPCTDCAAGKYQASSGADSCIACEAGNTYQGEPGLSLGGSVQMCCDRRVERDFGQMSTNPNQSP